MDLSPYLPSIFTILGVFIGGGITFAIQFHIQRREDRRAIKRLAIEAGLSEHRIYSEIVLRIAEITGRSPKFYPAEDYIVRYLFLLPEMEKIDTSRRENDRVLAEILAHCEARTHKINSRDDRRKHNMFSDDVS